MSFNRRNIVAILGLAAIVAGGSLLWPGCSPEPSKSRNRRSTQIVSKTSPAAQPKAKGVVKTARSQLGKKYVWGGESPRTGFDCSGLVWWVFRQHGISLPRISWRQYHVGRTVRSHLAPGDLVFFRSSLGKGRYHVGIFTGGSSFIHAPQTGSFVRVESISTSKWRRRFVGARRII
jgi:cell wall-associated NlpC family hydrolase